MATVTMDVSELDKLRDDITSKSEALKELENEIVKLKADKTVLKVTKKVFDHIVPFTVDWPGLHKYENAHRSFGHSVSSNQMELLEGAKRFITFMPSGDTWNKETLEYLNLDDVKQEIRKDLDKKLIDELAELRIDKNNTNLRMAELEIECNERRRLGDKAQQEVLTHLREKHEEEVANLRKRIADLEAKRVKESQDKLVYEMQQKLFFYTGRNFWERLINKKYRPDSR